MRAWKACSRFLGALLVLVGCGSPQETSGVAEGEDRWDPNTEDPSRIVPGGSAKLADLVVADDVGKEFGVDDDHIPYPDTYWPFVEEGVDHKWNNQEPASPLEKAMSVLDPAGVTDAKTWEHENHGSARAGVASWWGHCPGWTGAALFNRPVLHPVSVKTSPDSSGDLVECASGDAGCVTFRIGDINALEAEVFVDGANVLLGARCDTKPQDIKRDRKGRIDRNGTGCHGLNAGSLLVIMGNRMKKDHLPFAIDAQNDFNTDQVWNQPAYRYVVNSYSVIEKGVAIQLVKGSKHPEGGDYKWNKDAKAFLRLDIGLRWVAENGPNVELVSGRDSTHTMRMVSVIELDRPASDPEARVIGGEYVDDPSVGADRLTVPPFVWISNGPGSEQFPSHNPHLTSSFVQKLVALGTKPREDSPSSTPAAASVGSP